jgi:hypothetical protein
MTGSVPESAEAPPQDREALEREIEQTREELGTTVAALSRKLDVKTRVKTGAQSKVAAVKSGTQDKVAVGKERVRAQPWIPAAGAAVVLLTLVLVVWKRRA